MFSIEHHLNLLLQPCLLQQHAKAVKANIAVDPLESFQA
jgi:hypothetical protein